ncbi:hypothetical protein BS78_01G239600 [Paspalum vaginatum]|nr:hypothetical protein BS78_01G239600 [Paspalum vaginatum]
MGVGGGDILGKERRSLWVGRGQARPLGERKSSDFHRPSPPPTPARTASAAEPTSTRLNPDPILAPTAVTSPSADPWSQSAAQPAASPGAATSTGRTDGHLSPPAAATSTRLSPDPADSTRRRRHLPPLTHPFRLRNPPPSRDETSSSSGPLPTAAAPTNPATSDPAAAPAKPPSKATAPAPAVNPHCCRLAPHAGVSRRVAGAGDQGRHRVTLAKKPTSSEAEALGPSAAAAARDAAPPSLALAPPSELPVMRRLPPSGYNMLKYAASSLVLGFCIVLQHEVAETGNNKRLQLRHEYEKSAVGRAAKAKLEAIKEFTRGAVLLR